MPKIYPVATSGSSTRGNPSIQDTKKLQEPAFFNGRPCAPASQISSDNNTFLNYDFPSTSIDNNEKQDIYGRNIGFLSSKTYNVVNPEDLNFLNDNQPTDSEAEQETLDAIPDFIHERHIEYLQAQTDSIVNPRGARFQPIGVTENNWQTQTYNTVNPEVYANEQPIGATNYSTDLLAEEVEEIWNICEVFSSTPLSTSTAQEDIGLPLNNSQTQTYNRVNQEVYAKEQPIGATNYSTDLLAEEVEEIWNICEVLSSTPLSTSTAQEDIGLPFSSRPQAQTDSRRPIGATNDNSNDLLVSEAQTSRKRDLSQKNVIDLTNDNLDASTSKKLCVREKDQEQKKPADSKIVTLHFIFHQVLPIDFKYKWNLLELKNDKDNDLYEFLSTQVIKMNKLNPPMSHIQRSKDIKLERMLNPCKVTIRKIFKDNKDAFIKAFDLNYDHKVRFYLPNRYDCEDSLKKQLKLFIIVATCIEKKVISATDILDILNHFKLSVTSELISTIKHILNCDAQTIFMGHYHLIRGDTPKDIIKSNKLIFRYPGTPFIIHALHSAEIGKLVKDSFSEDAQKLITDFEKIVSNIEGRSLQIHKKEGLHVFFKNDTDRVTYKEIERECNNAISKKRHWR